MPLFVLQGEAGSSQRPMSPTGEHRSVAPMKRRLLIMLFITGLILLALGGWSVRGLRWTLSGGARRVPQTA